MAATTAHRPLVLSATPESAVSRTSTMPPQIIAYSMVVVPRTSLQSFVSSCIVSLVPVGFADSSRDSLKNSLRKGRRLQNSSTVILVVAVALIDRAGRVLLQRRWIAPMAAFGSFLGAR